jgi:type II secretory pathway component PulF
MPSKIYGAVTKHPKTGKIRKWLIPAYNREEVELFLNTGIPQKIITLGQIPPGRAHSLIRQHSSHFPLKDQVEFFEGLTPLIQVGFNPIKAFILQARSTRKLGVRIITMDIVHGILSGELLYMAFSRHRDVFDETILALIEEGENTGTLAETFEEIVRVQSRALEYRRRIVSSMTYPIIVIIMALSVTYIFTTILIPKIKTIYDNLHGDLPGITKAVVGASTFLQANPWVLIFPVVLIAVWIANIRKLNYQMWYCKFILAIPFVRDFARKSAITRGCRSLSVLLDSGVAMAKALTITARSTGTIYFQKVFEDIREMINRGESMTIAFQTHSDNFGILGDRLAAAVESGEASGEIDKVLARLSKTFEREMEVAIERLQETLVPAITIALAAMVGTIVFSIFLPLFGMGKVLMHATGH